MLYLPQCCMSANEWPLWRSILLSPYLQSAFWSLCKRTTASLSSPDRLQSCCKQMLRSSGLWVGVTVVDRLHVQLHRNSVSISEIWAAGAANRLTRCRRQPPSADSPCAWEERTGAKTRAPWLCCSGGSPFVGRGGLLVDYMQLTSSSVSNAESVPAPYVTSAFGKVPANQRIRGWCVCGSAAPCCPVNSCWVNTHMC